MISPVGKVIGRHGNVITDILEKSRVNNVKVVGDEEARKRGIDTGEDVSGSDKRCGLLSCYPCSKWRLTSSVEGKQSTMPSL